LIHRAVLRIVALTCLGTLVGGCLLTRIYTFKDQFCRYDANFRLQVEENVTLTMFHPVLLDTDVVWLVGAPPTERRQHGDVLRMRYVIEKLQAHPDSSYDIPIDLGFVLDADGSYRLGYGRLDRNLATLLTPEVITQAVENACTAHPSPFERSIHLDLSEADLTGLPTREELLHLLGPPSMKSADDSELVFSYRLKQATDRAEAARGVVWFDSQGRLRKLKFRYLRYEVRADFVRRQAVITIDL
jgi:hypothetical protein